MDFMILKNVKKFIFFLFIGSQVFASNKDDDPPYVNYAKEIMHPFIAECEKKYDLECIGTGGRFAYTVAGINISFVAYRKGTTEEARTLEVKMIETLLSRINADEKVRPFLSEYPFKSKDLHISIAFQKKDGTYYGGESIVYVSHIKNKLFYDIEDPKTKKLVDILEEPYEDALKIVQRK